MKYLTVFHFIPSPKPPTFPACLAFALVLLFWMRAHLAGIERKRASPWRNVPRWPACG